MPEKMSISVNGQSQVPPGFRFHPTEEELLQYYLRKKISCEKIDLDVVHDVDLNKLEPWDIQEKCKIGSTPQNDWYFFSHKDKKYPTGTRTNRATAAGFWKATGRDKVIYSNCRRIGMRKTLVFYKGRAPRGHKSDWIMHEYRLDDNLTLSDTANIIVSDATGDATQEEGWVVCRIFKKKLHHKTLDSSPNSGVHGVETRTNSHRPPSSCTETDQGTLEQIFQDMARTCKKQDDSAEILTAAMKNGLHDRIIVKLPSLEETPNFIMSTPPAACNNYQQIHLQMLLIDNEASMTNASPAVYQSETGLSNWSALDQLVASHFSGQSCETSKQLPCLNNIPTMGFCSSLNRPFNNDGSQDDIGDFDVWSFTKSSLSVADPLCHMSGSMSPL